MTRLRTTLVLLAGASLLAACGKGGQNAAAPSAAAASSASAAQAATSAAPANGPPVQITADELPTPKIGLWETTTTTNGQPVEVTRHCETGKKLDTTRVAKDCQSFVIKRTFTGGYVIDAACARGGASSSMHMSIQGDFLGGGYTSDGVMTMTIPKRAPMTFTTHSVAKYIGPCPPGQQDGE